MSGPLGVHLDSLLPIVLQKLIRIWNLFLNLGKLPSLSLYTATVHKLDINEKSFPLNKPLFSLKEARIEFLRQV